jgi:hypothetical protein
MTTVSPSMTWLTTTVLAGTRATVVVAGALTRGALVGGGAVEAATVPPQAATVTTANAPMPIDRTVMTSPSLAGLAARSNVSADRMVPSATRTVRSA